jgi:hypothetical protein
MRTNHDTHRPPRDTSSTDIAKSSQMLSPIVTDSEIDFEQQPRRGNSKEKSLRPWTGQEQTFHLARAKHPEEMKVGI